VIIHIYINGIAGQKMYVLMLEVKLKKVNTALKSVLKLMTLLYKIMHAIL
jgi:hypothetical protein